MSKFTNTIFFSLFLLIYLTNCSTSSTLPKSSQHKKNVLDTEELKSLKSYLQGFYQIKIQDTIIIKYDFNNDNCWDALDNQDRTYIESVILNYQTFIKIKSAERPDVSIFQFRESGQKQSSYKLDNTDIKIDNGYLRKLLFKQKATCGSSIIILPSGQFIISKSDPHFQVLELNSKKIKKQIQ